MHIIYIIYLTQIISYEIVFQKMQFNFFSPKMQNKTFFCHAFADQAMSWKAVLNKRPLTTAQSPTKIRSVFREWESGAPGPASSSAHRKDPVKSIISGGELCDTWLQNKGMGEICYSWWIPFTYFY